MNQTEINQAMVDTIRASNDLIANLVGAVAAALYITIDLIETVGPSLEPEARDRLLARAQLALALMETPPDDSRGA